MFELIQIKDGATYSITTPGSLGIILDDLDEPNPIELNVLFFNLTSNHDVPTIYPINIDNMDILCNPNTIGDQQRENLISALNHVMDDDHMDIINEIIGYYGGKIVRYEDEIV